MLVWGWEQAVAGGRGAVPAKAAALSHPLFMLPPASKTVPPPPACGGCSEKVISSLFFLLLKGTKIPLQPLCILQTCRICLPPSPTLPLQSHHSRPDPVPGCLPQPSGHIPIPIPFPHATALGRRCREDFFSSDQVGLVFFFPEASFRAADLQVSAGRSPGSGWPAQPAVK